jgi:type IV pilus assembly protein PilV
MFQRVNTQSTCAHNISSKRLNKRSTIQKGMTFIEVLIALVIMVTGILGAVAMQATAKKGSFDAMQRSLASSLAQDILERMRSNSSANLNAYAGTYGAFDPGAAPAPVCNTPGTSCAPAQLMATDIHQWTQSLRGADVTLNGNNVGGLIDGRGCITEANNTVTITITWQNKTGTVDGGGGACGTNNSKRRQVRINAFII